MRDMTYLCVSIFVRDLPQARRDIALAAEAGANLVELRIDTLKDVEQVHELVKNCALPCIVTNRPAWEGGQSELDEDERLMLLSFAGDAGAAYLDVELKAPGRATLRMALDQTPREQRAGLIISSHDFSGRPVTLNKTLVDLTSSGSDVDKIVWTARSIRDNLEAFEVLLHRQKPTIALCMGEAGMISRILARKFGAFLSFASLDSESATAPGQVSIHDLKRLYRWDEINARTKVYGVVAQPVMHSMSPAIHNASFEAVGFDGVYLPLLVEGSYESFKAFMETFLAFEPLHLSGLSVTLPHKENALRYLKEKGAEIEPLAERIGAVNTVLIERSDGRITLRGRNTDYAAILDSITAKLNGTREQLKGQHIAVIGAGGTGRTAVAALAEYGANVSIYNRTRDRADALAAEFDGHSGSVRAFAPEDLAGSQADVFLNTTSVGMYPRSDQSAWGQAPPALRPEQIVFDTIYNPPLTRFLQHAQQAGAKTIGGAEMFVRQAAAQFQAWTGRPAPLQVMRQVLESRLAT